MAPSVAQAAEPTPVVCIEGSTTSLKYGEVANCSIELAGDSDLFTFNGKANDFITLALGDKSANCDGPGFPCPIAQLFAPGSATPLLTLGPGSSVQTVTLPVNGSYSVRVSESGNDQAEDYGISVDRLYPRSPAANELAFGQVTVGETLDPAADQDLWTFTARNGAIVVLSLSDPTFGCNGPGFPCPAASVFAPDRSAFATLSASDTQTLTLPQAGTYAIRVYEQGLDQMESYALSLECLTEPCGVPTFTCNGLTPTIVGTEGDDVIDGTAGNDVIVGLGGNDLINGLGGNDVICGGADGMSNTGNDTLLGGSGADQLFGNDGDDILIGGDSADTLRGGSGRDSLFGGPGADQLFGDAGDDVLDGGTGNDSLNGGSGRDVCQSGDTTAPTGCEVIDPL